MLRPPGSGLLLLLILCCAGNALAAPAPVAVIVYRASPASSAPHPFSGPVVPEPRKVAQELRQALSDRGLSPVEGSLDQGLRIHAEQQDQPLLMDLLSVREQLNEGRSRLAHVELERAEAILLLAERRCQGLFVMPGTVPLYGEVLRWRGVALFELHRTAEAAQVFRRAQALLGVAQLTEADVRPDVVHFYRRVAQHGDRPAPLRLRPQLRPQDAGPTDPPIAVPPALLPAASLSVDAVAVPLGDGRGPAGLDVLPGEHVVKLHVPGYRPRAMLVQVPAEGLDLSLAVSADAVEGQLLGLKKGPSREGLSALCATLGLDSVLLASAGPDAGLVVLGGQRYSCGSAAFGQVRIVRGDGRASLQKRCMQLLEQLWSQPPPKQSEASLLTHPALLHPRPPPPPHTPIYRRPWIWIAALAVTSGVVLGVTLWPRPQPQTLVVIEPGSFALHALGGTPGHR